jgi:hypothetical protein
VDGAKAPSGTLEQEFASAAKSRLTRERQRRQRWPVLCVYHAMNHSRTQWDCLAKLCRLNEERASTAVHAEPQACAALCRIHC